MLNKIIISTTITASLFANSISMDIVKTPRSSIKSYNTNIQGALQSVVNISTKQNLRNINNSLEQIFDDPFFKQFFNIQFLPNNSTKKQSLGSGVIISKDGYIVTNAHLIKNATEILISLNKNSKQYEAKVVGIDNLNDIAVLKIKATNLTPIKIGNSQNVLLGDIVFTIGNPYAISPVVSKGIISFINHSTNTTKNSFIQTDAKVNSLNSGGALVNSNGVLIGINYSSNNDIGFVTPVDVIKSTIKNLILNGNVTKGYLGVTTTNISSNLLPLYKHQKGVLVLDVDKNSCAKNANIKRGDLIYKINDHLIGDTNEFNKIINSFNYKDKISIFIERDKKDLLVSLNLDKKENLSVNIPILNGLYVNELNSYNKKKFRISSNIKGVLINDIISQSIAEKVGFETGDIIVQVEDVEVQNLNQLQNAIKKYKNQEKRVYINRYGKLLIIVVK